MTPDYDTASNPDTPIPFILTPKAHAFLNRTARAVHTAGAAVIDGAAEWACGRCRTGWFGPVPADGLCRDCRGHR